MKIKIMTNKDPKNQTLNLFVCIGCLIEKKKTLVFVHSFEGFSVR